jgi:hypothetical protein
MPKRINVEGLTMGPDSLLVAEVAALDHAAADKLRVIEHLARVAGMESPDGHRPLTESEVAAQERARPTIEQWELIQRVEYGTFVAVEPITVGGRLAYRVGEAVPVSNVDRHGYARSEPPAVRRVRPTSEPPAAVEEEVPA